MQTRRAAHRTLVSLPAWALAPASVGLAEPFEPRLETNTTNRNVLISWCASPLSSGNVQIDRRTSLDAPWQSLGSVSSGSCSLQDVSTKAGTSHYYRLQASAPAVPQEVVLSTVPEHPINDRRDAVVAVINSSGVGEQGQFRRPHIPPHGTSADGRVAVQMGGHGAIGSRRKHIYLAVPEKLGVPGLRGIRRRRGAVPGISTPARAG